MYTDRNFKTKKALKEAVAAGERVTIYAPGLGEAPCNGRTTVEGPPLSRAPSMVCGGSDERWRHHFGEIICTTSSVQW